MRSPLPQTWDLNRFFEGGSHSQAFVQFLEGLRADIAALEQELGRLASGQASNLAASLPSVAGLLQKALLKIREADSFTACLAAENQNDKQAVILAGQVRTIGAAYASASTRFDDLLTRIGSVEWKALLQRPELQGIAYPLEERRALAAEKLPPEQEALVNELAVDGYHGWGELYNTTVSKFRVPFEENAPSSSCLQAKPPIRCTARTAPSGRGFSIAGRKDGRSMPITAPMRSTIWEASASSCTSAAAGTRFLKSLSPLTGCRKKRWMRCGGL